MIRKGNRAEDGDYASTNTVLYMYETLPAKWERNGRTPITFLYGRQNVFRLFGKCKPVTEERAYDILGFGRGCEV